MKPRDSLKDAIDQVENEACIVFHACEVDKFRGDKQKFDRRYLLLANISVFFFKTGRKPKQVLSEYWANLIGVEGLINQSSIITLFFKQVTYKFKIDEPQEMKTIRLKLGDFFQRIFTIEEQEMLGLFKQDLYRISCRSIQNSFGQYSRLLSYIKSNKIEIDKETEKRFFKYLVYRQKNISIPKKIKASEFKAFMYGIDALTHIESISFKEMKSIDVFQQLLTFFSTLFENPSNYFRKENDKNIEYYKFRIRDNVRHIRFKKIKALNKFDEFFYNLTNGQIEHKINSLSFENMKLIENNFYSIDKLCRSLKSKRKNDNSSGIKSLSFNSSLSEEQYNYFLSSFLNNDTTKYLCMISLNNTFNLSMPLLLDKIRNIYSLSLANCNINIMTTLQSICRARMDNLKMLNLSGNFCSKSAPPDFNDKKVKKRKKDNNNMGFDCEQYNPNDDVEFDDDDIIFPQSLNVLYVRNVRWGLRFRSLIAFLKTAASFIPKGKNNNSQFRLSIRGIKGGSFENEEEFNSSLYNFNDFNSYLAGFFTDTKKSSITHLDWAGNPVSSEFIEFLRKSKKLVELDVSYCFCSELENQEESKDQDDSQNDSLLHHFADYLVNDAKKLESLIICGKLANEEENANINKKKEKGNQNEKTFLSQNLSGNSIFPLFQAIKETKNPLNYINISGQKLENPDGLNYFAEAIGSNPNIQKVSFKNTGFESKEQFNYFVSKVKRNKPIFVEWPSEEMKNIGESNISHFKNLLIRLSKLNLYYEDKKRKDSSIDFEKKSKTDKKNMKSRDKSSDDDYDDYSDYGNDIKFDKLLFGKNLMARKIEGFLFDTEKEFPQYFSKEVEEMLSISQEENDNDDDDEAKNKKNKKKQKNIDDENDNKNKKKVKKTNSDDDSEDEDEDKNKGKNKKANKKVKKIDSDDDDSEDDDDDEKVLKNKKKYLLSKTEKKRRVSDDDDDDSEEEDEVPKKKNKSKKKVINKGVSISSDDDYEENDDYDDESDDNDNEKWKFPNGIRPRNDKKLMKEIKEKFSLENLMTNLVKGSD